MNVLFWSFFIFSDFACTCLALLFFDPFQIIAQNNGSLLSDAQAAGMRVQTHVEFIDVIIINVLYAVVDD